MNEITVLFAMFILVLLIALAWTKGIDHMQRNHPDYDGRDLFDEEGGDHGHR